MNRLQRLTAILIHLQSKKVVTAAELADRFDISQRTVYRDIRSLEEAGVPIGAEAGMGYYIVDGYHLPPVMFTSEEASALSLMGKLTGRMTDQSVEQSFRDALLKIKSVLRGSEKDKLERLESLIMVKDHVPAEAEEKSRPLLIQIQTALVQEKAISIRYVSNDQESTERIIEPLGLVYYSLHWHLIAWCRLRLGFRDFRTDRIKSFRILDEKTGEHPFDINEYMENYQNEQPLQRITVRFHHRASRYVGQQKYWFGWVSETKDDQYTRMTFLTASPCSLARWIMTFGDEAIPDPNPEFEAVITQHLRELAGHYEKIYGIPVSS